MQQIKCLELLCGKGIITDSFKERNHQALKLDIRKRKGICEPDFHLDLMKVKDSWTMFPGVNVIWFSPPCQCWSYAAGAYHFFEGEPQTESTKHLISVLEKGLRIIEEISPVLYFIENPRGKLRYYKGMIDFLIRTNGMIKECTYADYGFPTPKPTNIFTNAHDLILKNEAPFGRGAKNYAGNMNNMTVVAKQEIPKLLADEIVKHCENHFKSIS